MKKRLFVLLVALVMAVSAIVVLSACNNGETYTGEYSYVYNTNTTYGAKVDVTVKDGKITNVKLYEEADANNWTRTSSGWHDKTGGWGMHEGDLGYADAEKAYPDYLKTFIGKTVEDVLAIKVKVAGSDADHPGEPLVFADDEAAISPKSYALSGATQSSGRIILAIQNALSKIESK